MNNTNLILSDESEKMKNRELLEEYFSRSLEIDLLLRLYPDDEDTLYQIVNLLVDLVIPFTLDAVITFILSRMKVEEANAKLRAAA